MNTTGCGARVTVSPGARRIGDDVAASCASSLRVLGFTLAEGPVLPGHLDEVDEQILRSEPGILRQQRGSTAHEVPLLRRLAAGGKRDLHQHNIVAALNAEIGGIVDQSIRAVLGDDLEPILLRHGELLDHGAMNAVGDRPPVFVRFSGVQRNANKWHGGKVSAEDRRIYAADRTPSKSQKQVRSRLSRGGCYVADPGEEVESDPIIASMRWFRLAKIWLIALKYGLDEFLLGHERFAWLRPTVHALTFWRDLSAPRAVRLRLALEALGPI